MKKFTKEQIRQILYEALFGCKEELFRQYWKLIDYIIRKIFQIRNISYIKEDIEDLRNDVFVKLFDKNCERLRQYKEDRGRNFKGWITLIAHRIVFNELRRKHFDALPAQSNKVSIEDIFKDLAEKGLENHEKEIILQIMEKNLAKLPTRDNLILQMYYEKGLSPEAIVSCLKMSSVNAFYAAKSRAISRLKQLIMDNLNSDND